MPWMEQTLEWSPPAGHEVSTFPVLVWEGETSLYVYWAGVFEDPVTFDFGEGTFAQQLFVTDAGPSVVDPATGQPSQPFRVDPYLPQARNFRSAHVRSDGSVTLFGDAPGGGGNT